MSKNNNSNVGNYYPLLKNTLKGQRLELSFLNKKWNNIESWRKKAKVKVKELLAFEPKNVPLNARIEDKYEIHRVITEKISYDMPYAGRVEGYFLYPSNLTGKLPAVIALHDHGGFKYYGKEKIVTVKNEPKILKEFKNTFFFISK